jgi:hypothetical protein
MRHQLGDVPNCELLNCLYSIFFISIIIYGIESKNQLNFQKSLIVVGHAQQRVAPYQRDRWRENERVPPRRGERGAAAWRGRLGTLIISSAMFSCGVHSLHNPKIMQK